MYFMENNVCINFSTLIKKKQIVIEQKLGVTIWSHWAVTMSDQKNTSLFVVVRKTIFAQSDVALFALRSDNRLAELPCTPPTFVVGWNAEEMVDSVVAN